jgi:hypothetical protein
VNFEQLSAEKKALEEALATKIAVEVATFRLRTGYSPDSISVNLIEFTQIGDTVRRFMVDSVNANIPI